MYDDSRADNYKVVVFQKIYDDETVKLVSVLKARGVRTVFDLCDNLFHYDLDNPPGQQKRIEQLNRMIETVDEISVSTPPLVDIIQERSGRVPTIIDDAIEEPKISRLKQSYYTLQNYFGSAKEKPFRVVWYGVSGTKNPPYGMIDLSRILPSLSELHKCVPLSLTVISNSSELFREYTSAVAFPKIYHEWNMTTFPYLFSGHDVCIVPVNANPLTLCKTNNRLVLSLLLNVPVVADRIPSYEEFSEFVLFSDWEHNLRTYASDPELRRRHVQLGRKHIRTVYTKDRTVSQWSSLFNRLLNS